MLAGDQAVAETLWNGTFGGDLVAGGHTIAATGRRMENFPVAFVCTVAGTPADTHAGLLRYGDPDAANWCTGLTGALGSNGGSSTQF